MTRIRTAPLAGLALATLPLLALHASAQDAPARDRPEPFVLPDGQAPRPMAGGRPSEEAIRKAIRATLDERRAETLSSDGTALSGAAYREFSRQFSEAKKPHCMGPDATRHQPTSTVYKGWNVGVSGVFALPFWAAAIARGKCSWTP